VTRHRARPTRGRNALANRISSANVQPWAWQTTNYAADGHVVSQNGVNDDGSVWSV
jgi:hypothetical protein